jgi:hypothetical protein
VLLSGSYKRQTNSRAAVLGVHSQPVQISSPAIRRGYEYTEDRAIGGGNEQTARVMAEQSLHVIEAVGHGGVLAASLLP